MEQPTGCVAQSGPTFIYICNQVSEDPSRDPGERLNYFKKTPKRLKSTLSVDGSKYFCYHHTEADTIDTLDPDEFNRCVAAMAVMAYVVGRDAGDAAACGCR